MRLFPGASSNSAETKQRPPESSPSSAFDWAHCLGVYSRIGTFSQCAFFSFSSGRALSRRSWLVSQCECRAALVREEYGIVAAVICWRVTVGCCYFRSNYKAVRGVYDLLPVRNRKRKRSKYGVKLSSADKEHRQQRWSHRFLFTSSDRTFFNQFLWATWRDKEGQPLLRKLEESETPSPHMRWFNRWFRLKMQRTGGTARD